jgi:LmbE family N-acetylglucosaminyl deacetylase
LPHLVVSYESPEYYFWSAASEFGKFSPNFYVNLSKSEINKKIKAMNMYKTQIRADQRDGSSLTALARIRGNEIGLDYAEAYHIHRLFV